MWLPTPLYERVPQFWLLLGILFMASGTYLGFDYPLAFIYFGVGFFCVAWSVCIFVMRMRHRQQPQPVETPQSMLQSKDSNEADGPEFSESDDGMRPREFADTQV